MRQAQIEQFGPPEVLHTVEADDPVPAAGQALIEVEAAGITFVETQIRAGTFAPPGMPPITFPAVLGNGVEGTVVAIGPEVDAGLVGSAVVSATGGLGGYRDLVAVDADGVIPVPAGLARGAAVAMLADGRTALAQVRAADIRPGDRVLVLAAAGGVGSLLVQLAVDAGATVVAAAGGARKTSLARELGADHAVDYLDAAWVDAVRAEVAGIDVVFDGVGGEIGRTATGLLVPEARRVAFGLASGSWAAVDPDDARSIQERRGAPSHSADNRALVQAGLDHVAAGRLRPVVGQAFPLADAAAAHAAIEHRTTIGKTILVPHL